MVRYLTAAAVAVALAAATIVAPNKAEAVTPVWVVPAIVAAGIGGLTVGAMATANAAYVAPGARGNIYVQPRAEATCRIVRERTPSGGWARVEICE